jgi:hypothetical protein
MYLFFCNEVFTGMLRGIAKASGGRILSGPEPLPRTGKA